MKHRACGALLAGLTLVIAAPAAAAADEGECRNGGFPRENSDFGLAAINGAGRAYLLYDMDGCPSPSPKCEKAGEGYVVAGDRVVTGRSKGDYVCAYFPSRGGGSAGWVAKSRLRPLPFANAPAVSSWLGGWSDEGNPEVRITGGRAGLSITGEAYWPGLKPKKDWPPGWPHTGDIEGKLTLQGNRAHYDDGDCKVDFVMVGDMLIASDNDMCGGMNVRFDGVYRRERR